MPVTVREAVIDDAAAIARVQVDAWRIAYAGLIDDTFLANMSVADRTASWTQTAESPPEGLSLRVAELDGEVVGWSAISTGHEVGAGPEWGELRGYYVHPGRWGRGAGRALMQDALSALRGRGCSWGYLWVLRGNERAIRIYEHFGWRLTEDEKTRESRGATLLEQRMTRSLHEDLRR